MKTEMDYDANDEQMNVKINYNESTNDNNDDTNVETLNEQTKMRI